MSRLSVRIFIAFWLVIALTVTGIWVINTQLAALEADDRTQRERIAAQRRELLRDADRALQSSGEQGLIAWIETADRRTRQRLFVLAPDGEELAGREVPQAVARVAARWQQRTPPEREREPWVGRGMVVGTIAGPSGRYLLALQRAPQPWLLRVFGPLGPAGVIALALAVSGLISFWLARTITRPILDLQAAGRALGRGDLTARAGPASVARNDELGVLARDFNGMADRLEALIASQQRLLRDVSHELRSPLARMQVSLALATRTGNDEQRQRNFERITREVERLERLIGEILDYTRLAGSGAAHTERFDLVELLDDIVESARIEGATRGVKVVRQSGARAEIEGDLELLYRAVENVVRNAVRHSPDGGTVVLELSHGGSAGGWRLQVVDEGPGVPDGQLESIFEPFVRVSAERSETGPGGGVGLAIAREAVNRHGGRIEAENRTDGGLAVSIDLPGGRDDS